MKNIFNIAILFILALNAGITLALPPQIEADRQLFAAELAVKEQRWDDAVAAYEAAEATGIKQRSVDFQYFYGNALVQAGQYAKGKERIEVYLSSAGTSAKYYREALIALNSIEQGKKRLAEDQAMEAAKEAQKAKLQAAWITLQTKLTEMPPSGDNQCANLTSRIKSFSKSARNINCECRVQAVDHPAWRDHKEDFCEAKWEANKILDGDISYWKLRIEDDNPKAKRAFRINTYD